MEPPLSVRDTSPPITNQRAVAILDAAEAEFSAHGFDGVTLRTIAQRAGVDVALPHYYFASKEKLFEKVFERRAKELNAWREKALNEAIDAARPGAPTVEAIVRAYLEPLLIGPHIKDPGWTNYLALIAYVNNKPGWGGQLMAQHFDPLIRKFLDALRLAMPGIRERDLFWGYHCLSGALTLAFAQTGRIDQLSSRLVLSSDLDEACEHMIRFMTGGFETSRRGGTAARAKPASAKAAKPARQKSTA